MITTTLSICALLLWLSWRAQPWIDDAEDAGAIDTDYD